MPKSIDLNTKENERVTRRALDFALNIVIRFRWMKHMHFILCMEKRIEQLEALIVKHHIYLIKWLAVRQWKHKKCK